MHVYQADDFIAGVIYLWYALKKKIDKITTPGNSQAFMIVFRKIHYTTLCKMRTFLLNLQFLPFAEMIDVNDILANCIAEFNKNTSSYLGPKFKVFRCIYGSTENSWYSDISADEFHADLRMNKACQPLMQNQELYNILDIFTHYLSTILCPIGGCSTINTFTNGDDNDDDCITSQQPSQADIILDVPIIPPHLYKQSKDIIKKRMYFVYRLNDTSTTNVNLLARVIIPKCYHDISKGTYNFILIHNQYDTPRYLFSTIDEGITNNNTVVHRENPYPYQIDVSQIQYIRPIFKYEYLDPKRKNTRKTFCNNMKIAEFSISLIPADTILHHESLLKKIVGFVDDDKDLLRCAMKEICNY